ncbi:diguanylate cyclase domain-containing protein [Luteibacter yeojuensis]|uniref:PAS domain S-box-containing protein/diguanylate cyclase (GGDEF)-like protein n=1 Tax=Luteibacter yeojuensis TaxID=345309 RepID=A0A0F3KML9_9GAMM|nr:diguanylate cyclase [Luteibacter yeojuensis]KJV32515.1 hypothetical protein VI08_12320 [Luteibacter yeojuensis]
MSDPEELRLSRLHELGVLDTASEAFFDALVQAAAEVACMPISLVTLIDRHRQWFKANMGLAGLSETPREYAFCDHVVRACATIQVTDARLDPRFADNPFVTAEGGIRAYTGAPLILSDGTCVGSLCVLDREPRTLAPDQVRVLRHLAQAASLALEQRRDLVHQRETAEAEAVHARALEAEVQAQRQFLQRTGAIAGVGGWEFDLASQRVLWSEHICRIHDMPTGYQPTLAEALSFYAPEVQETITQVMDQAIVDGESWDITVPMKTAAGRDTWVRLVGAVETEGGVAVRLAGAVQDVTERKLATLAMEVSERRFRKLFQYSLGLICTHALDGEILSVNPATAASLGYEVHELVGRNLVDFMPPHRQEALFAYLTRICVEHTDTGVLDLIAKDGSKRYWRYQNVLDDDATEPYVLGHAQDVTEHMRTERTLVEWSTKDPLTQVYNRRYLGTLEHRDAAAAPWGCLVVDLDHFKGINDTHGHARGDEILVDAAAVLRAVCEEGDAVVRMGGDEFLVVLARPGRIPDVVRDIARRMAGREWAMSVGAAVAEPGDTMDQVIARADGALYTRRASERAARH